MRSTCFSGANVEPTRIRVSTAPTTTTPIPNTKKRVKSWAMSRLTLSSGMPSTASDLSLERPSTEKRNAAAFAFFTVKGCS